MHKTTRFALLASLAIPLHHADAASVLYRNAVLANNPVAYYEFDETGGATAADSAGSFDGTYSGSLGLGAPSGAPNLGTAVDFSGGFVAIPNLGTLQQSTVEAWVQLDAVNPGCCTGILTANGWDPGKIHFNVQANNLEHAVNGGAPQSVFTTGGLTAGEWYHIVVTNDGIADETIFYLNGAQVADDGDHSINSIVFGTTGMQIGAWDGTRQLDGRIDEVAVYDSILSPADVANHYAAAVPEPGTSILLALGATAAVMRRRRK